MWITRPGRRALAHGSLHGGLGDSLVPPYTCGSVYPSHGGQGEARCVFIHAIVSMHPSQGAGRIPGVSFYTLKRLSHGRGRVNAWCPLTHAKASLARTGGRPKAWCLVPSHTRRSVSLSHLFTRQCTRTRRRGCCSRSRGRRLRAHVRVLHYVCCMGI